MKQQTYKTKTSRKLHKFMACLALFSMLFCLSGCGKKTPREALEEAYQKTFFTGSKLENLLGLTDIHTKLSENKAYSTGLSLKIQELSGADLGSYAGFLSGLGITMDSASDLLNRKSAATVDITYGGTTYLTLGGQIQGSKIHITSPQLLNGSLMVNLSTLKTDLASDSMIARALRDAGVALPEELFSELTESFLNPSSLLKLSELTESFQKMWSLKTLGFRREVKEKGSYPAGRYYRKEVLSCNRSGSLLCKGTSDRGRCLYELRFFPHCSLRYLRFP